MQVNFYDKKNTRITNVSIAVFISLLVAGLIAMFHRAYMINDATRNIMIGVVGVLNLVYIIRTAINRPTVIVEDDGIRIKEPVDLGLIRWDEIKTIDKFYNGAEQNLAIYLYDPEAHLKSLNAINRSFAQMAAFEVKTHVYIRDTHINHRMTELLQLLESMHPSKFPIEKKS